MRTIQRRLRRVEDRFSQRKSQGVRVVIRAAAVRLALDADTCEKILEECGYLRDVGGASVVTLYDIPDGLDVEETERFLRERGAELCT